LGRARSAARGAATAPAALNQEVSDAVDRLRDLLPAAMVDKLRSYESYGLVDVLRTQAARAAAVEVVESSKATVGAALPLQGIGLGLYDPWALCCLQDLRV